MEKLNGKDQMIETIGRLDEQLMLLKEIWANAEGNEIPEESYEDFVAIQRKIVQLMVLRKRLAKYLLDTYGIFIFNGWES